MLQRCIDTGDWATPCKLAVIDCRKSRLQKRLVIAIGVYHHIGATRIQIVYGVKKQRQPIVVDQSFVNTAHTQPLTTSQNNAGNLFAIRTIHRTD